MSPLQMCTFIHYQIATIWKMWRFVNFEGNQRVFNKPLIFIIIMLIMLHQPFIQICQQQKIKRLRCCPKKFKKFKNFNIFGWAWRAPPQEVEKAARRAAIFPFVLKVNDRLRISIFNMSMKNKQTYTVFLGVLFLSPALLLVFSCLVTIFWIYFYPQHWTPKNTGFYCA